MSLPRSNKYDNKWFESADPDPYQKVTDPEYRFIRNQIQIQLFFHKVVLKFQKYDRTLKLNKYGKKIKGERERESTVTDTEI